LGNRQIVSRAFPELYRDLRVQYLAGFFRSLQEILLQQAPAEGETPLVVLLTPGRFNESYFEHLFLARQLGFPLVEGSDLTVRDNTLYLKTLDGLMRVHAVLRRLDDDFCDPLELRTDSALGDAGSYSLRASLRHLHDAATQVRGKLSQENWQALSSCSSRWRNWMSALPWRMRIRCWR
jgi:uncharacterized circularly permuted ATP-grasp superfamily protein